MDDTTKKKIEQIIADMNHYQGGTTSDTIQRPMMARILSIVAEEQAKSADRLEQQTDKLIWLTRGLLALTAALLLFTIFLCADAYCHDKAVSSVNPADSHSTK